MFDTLRKANLKIQLDNSEFLKRMFYMPHRPYHHKKKGLKPNEDKIKAILNYPIPKTPKEIRIGFFRLNRLL